MPTMNLNVQRKQIDAAILTTIRGNANSQGSYLGANAELAIECGLPGLTTADVRKSLRRLQRSGRVEVTYGPHYEDTNQRFLSAVHGDTDKAVQLAAEKATERAADEAADRASDRAADRRSGFAADSWMARSVAAQERR